jgi:signal transduction histidine kinase
VTLRGKLLAGLSPVLLAIPLTVAVGTRMNHIAVLIGLVGGLLALGISTTWVSRLLRPLGVLSNASRRIGQGDLAVRAVVSGNDEVALLARDFNEMAERLETYRKSSLGQLLQARQNLEAAMDSIPDPILMIGAGGALLQANAAAQAQFGVGPDSPGAPWAETLPTAVREPAERARGHVLTGKGPVGPRGLDEAVVVDSQGGSKRYLVRAVPVYDESGTIDGTTIVLQDVTRLVLLDELRSNLVATVAHEFRTPLTSIRMAIHLCVEGLVGALTPKQADLLLTARDECERLQTIVDDLLDASRVSTGTVVGQRETVPVDALVRGAVETLRAEANGQHVKLRVEAMPDLGGVSVDRDQINIALSNLLANAIHHSSAGGVVTMSAKRAGNAIELDVRDDGPGVAHELQRSIFEPYVQAPGGRPGVAGLGLAIAKRIVDQHGGEIGVESTPGAGARFWIRIPPAPSSLDASDA